MSEIHKYCDSQYLIIVADAADAVSVNFSGQCKFFQTERENLPFYCVHSMFNVCNLYKCVLIYAHLGVKVQLQKLCQCKKNDNYQVCIMMIDVIDVLDAEVR